MSTENRPTTEQLPNQTEAKGKVNDRSSWLSNQLKEAHVNIQEQKENRMDYKKIEQLKKEDPTAETLALTITWNKLDKPND